MQMHNNTTYSGRFARMKMKAFGIEQVLKFETEIELYQARSCPELWRARPHFENGLHKWEASSADELAAIVAADFEQMLSPFRVKRYTGPRLDRPMKKNVVAINHRRAG